jgi:hypothetical protein
LYDGELTEAGFPRLAEDFYVLRAQFFYCLMHVLNGNGNGAPQSL